MPTIKKCKSEVFETKSGRLATAFYNTDLDKLLKVPEGEHFWIVMLDAKQRSNGKRGRPCNHSNDQMIVTVFRNLRSKENLKYDAAIELTAKLFGINRRTVIRYMNRHHKEPLKLYEAVLAKIRPAG